VKKNMTRNTGRMLTSWACCTNSALVNHRGSEALTHFVIPRSTLPLLYRQFKPLSRIFCEEYGYLSGKLCTVDRGIDFIVPDQAQAIKVARSDRRPLSYWQNVEKCVGGSVKKLGMLSLYALLTPLESRKVLFDAPANAFLHLSPAIQSRRSPPISRPVAWRKSLRSWGWNSRRTGSPSEYIDRAGDQYSDDCE
jgi:hypothetical protein